jgi:hypothetical protein
MIMRWNRRYGLKDRLKDQLGGRRVRRRFLWWPLQFGYGATRWLEWVDVVEEVCEIDVGGSMEWGEYAYEWRAVGFADEAAPKYATGAPTQNVGTAGQTPKQEG